MARTQIGPPSLQTNMRIKNSTTISYTYIKKKVETCISKMAVSLVSGSVVKREKRFKTIAIIMWNLMNYLYQIHQTTGNNTVLGLVATITNPILPCEWCQSNGPRMRWKCLWLSKPKVYTRRRECQSASLVSTRRSVNDYLLLFFCFVERPIKIVNRSCEASL